MFYTMLPYVGTYVPINICLMTSLLCNSIDLGSVIININGVRPAFFKLIITLGAFLVHVVHVIEAVGSCCILVCGCSETWPWHGCMLNQTQLPSKPLAIASLNVRCN